MERPMPLGQILEEFDGGQRVQLSTVPEHEAAVQVRLQGNAAGGSIVFEIVKMGIVPGMVVVAVVRGGHARTQLKKIRRQVSMKEDVAIEEQKKRLAAGEREVHEFREVPIFGAPLLDGGQ